MASGRPPAPASVTGPTRPELRRRLAAVTLQDEHRLRRRLDALRGPDDPRLPGLLEAVARAEAVVERRKRAVPDITFPEDLPVTGRLDDVAEALRHSQVVVVAGETGSGKTTQLPKLCLSLGRGVRGAVAHTQPRRIAARAVAERVAEELGTPLGGLVGYRVRFTEQASADSLLRVVTDGILLAEVQQDRLLRRYDTVILDEAHERSLTIDFLLGYLRTILPRRPDLRVIITSATIDPERFARHFDGAPVVEVSGRTYPVEVRYRPLVEDGGGAEPDGPDGPDGEDDRASGPKDPLQGIVEAVEELRAEGPGDVLVFLSGEREIRDAADALRDSFARAGGPREETEVLPLYARLSASEQHRVFAPHTGRRVVLATNVAETSLTVPGIRYVVDTGTARISRYSARLKVQRLPIERVSQASADQRAGRCGRVADGVCIRLYSEQDYQSRPRFTDPEIQRTNLAAVLLQMAALGLGDLAAFPFVDPPDRRSVRDGTALLQELGALTSDSALTSVGRQLAQLPVDPRLGRMVLEADRNGCLPDVLVIVAALSIQDPRERPIEHRQAADAMHARFSDDSSDFLAYLRLWHHLRARQRELSSNQFRRMCREEFLHYLRVREWQDLHSQLRRTAGGLGLGVGGRPEPADDIDADRAARIHQSLLAGLLSHVGLRDPEKRDYAGARGARFGISPGSALFRHQPRWVMAAELVETTRLWARVAARIDPDWVEPLAGHLVKRTYSEPHWERRQQAVMGYERVTLYGVPLVVRRKVPYARVDPVLSRELFLRHALVEGDWTTTHRFFHENRRLLEDVEQLEHRARRRDLVVDEEELYRFYDERVPADVVSGRHFDAWWRKARREDPAQLTLTQEWLLAGRGLPSVADYPDEWTHTPVPLPLHYTFEPGSPQDGVAVTVPVAALGQVADGGFDWQVPGLRAELATALVRSLPKDLRRSLVPAPDTAARALQGLPLAPDGRRFRRALGDELHRLTGVDVPDEAWDLERVPAHLRMTFRVVDDGGRELAVGKDLAALRRRLAPRLRAAVASAAAGLERDGMTAWDLEDLPREVDRVAAGGVPVTGYPALVDRGSTVSVRVLATPREQRAAMRAGTARLLVLTVPSPVKAVAGGLSTSSKLVLASSPHGSVQALLDDALRCAVEWLVDEAGGPVWDASSFAALQERVRAALPDVLAAVLHDVEEVLTVLGRVRRSVAGSRSVALLSSLTDLRAHVDSLVPPGFLTRHGRDRLPDLVRYLRADEERFHRMQQAPERDRASMAVVAGVQAAVDAALAALPEERRQDEDVAEVRWMVEELRVGLFAPGVRTAYTVSEKRVLKAVDRLHG